MTALLISHACRDSRHNECRELCTCSCHRKEPAAPTWMGMSDDERDKTISALREQINLLWTRITERDSLLKELGDAALMALLERVDDGYPDQLHDLLHRLAGIWEFGIKAALHGQTEQSNGDTEQGGE